MKSKPAVVNRIPITEARINLGAVVKRVHLNGEYFILEKDGIPIVGIMGADELEDYLELQDPRIREHIRKSHAEFIAGKSRPVADFLSQRAASNKEHGSRRSKA
jgi:PHD/YefM family antitoxin component YafN of YafNO toxin-antitoxin module